MLLDLTKAAETRHNYRLRNDEREFHLRAQLQRVVRQTERWVVGAKSHPDERWRNVSFLPNALQELDDALNYIDGEIFYRQQQPKPDV